MLQALTAVLPATVRNMIRPLAAHAKASHQVNSATGSTSTYNPWSTLKVHMTSMSADAEHLATLRALEAVLPLTIENMLSPLGAHPNAFHWRSSVMCCVLMCM